MKNESRKAEENLCFINQKQARVHGHILMTQKIYSDMMKR